MGLYKRACSVTCMSKVLNQGELTMHPIRRVSPLAIALILAVGATSACSSSSSNGGTGGSGAGGSTSGTGGHGTGGSGTGGSGTGGAAGNDAGVSPDAPVDAPAGDAGDASSVDSPASMTLTSPAFTEGGTFPTANTCAGVNTSPQLTWTAGPAGTMSYALALTDLNNAAVHWVIWNIPVGTTTLPAALAGDTTLTTPAGAMQLHRLAFFGAGGAYRGPCPGGTNHTYQFEVYAVSTTTLAGITGASTTENIKALALAASLAHGDLSGVSNATAPPADASGQ
jgi:Raf kinase inhibitor-like YbhB/YbcL family protein